MIITGGDSQARPTCSNTGSAASAWSKATTAVDRELRKRRQYPKETRPGREASAILRTEAAHIPGKAYGLNCTVTSTKELTASISMWHRPNGNCAFEGPLRGMTPRHCNLRPMGFSSTGLGAGRDERRGALREGATSSVCCCLNFLLRANGLSGRSVRDSFSAHHTFLENNSTREDRQVTIIALRYLCEVSFSANCSYTNLMMR
jgi:hypothetical protein